MAITKIPILCIWPQIKVQSIVLPLVLVKIIQLMLICTVSAKMGIMEIMDIAMSLIKLIGRLLLLLFAVLLEVLQL